MTAAISTKNRHDTKRQAALAKIAQIGPLIEGHLSQFKRPGCVEPGWHLTFKKKGKTSTVYVPVDLAHEVKTWTKNYRQLKKLIREVTRHSLGLIRGHVANRRAALPSQALTKPKAPKP